MLGAAYDCGRQEILEGIEQLTMMPILQFEQLDVLHRILEDSSLTMFVSNSNASFSGSHDCSVTK